jgi:hypothetical protein
MRIHARAVAAVLMPVLLSGAVPSAAQQRMNFNFTPSSRNGVCMVTFPGGRVPGGDTPYALQLSYRVSDGNFGAAVQVNGWAKAQANADNEVKRPMTLVFDTGKTTISRSGGYSSGFNDQAWGGWGAGPGSDAAFAMLAEAKSVRVKFDGQDFGSVDLQMKRLAHSSLSQCADRLRGGQG